MSKIVDGLAPADTRDVFIRHLYEPTSLTDIVEALGAVPLYAVRDPVFIRCTIGLKRELVETTKLLEALKAEASKEEADRDSDVIGLLARRVDTEGEIIGGYSLQIRTRMERLSAKL